MRGLITAVLVGSLVAVAGCPSSCNRPSEADCREAIENVRAITKTDQTSLGWDIDRAIRSCVGGSTKKAVKCIKAAKTRADLIACDPQYEEAMKGKKGKSKPPVDTKPGGKAEPSTAPAKKPANSPPAAPAKPGDANKPAGDKTPDGAKPPPSDTAKPGGDKKPPAANE